MAQEIKNTFLKSKMNKDLDDRILPNGEYRDARNISVGRSEDNDVGALENIIGNDLVTGTDIGNGLTIIGIEADNSTDRLFVFLTDYTDPDVANPTNAPSTSRHYIYSYNNATGQYTRRVQGEFLNFSTTNRITGINLLENLLFWTDNRNQPRKINVDLARAFEPGGVAAGEDYYSAEHQISVAKYNPYQTIELYSRADLQVLAGATTTVFEVSGHRRTELLPLIGATAVCLESSPPTTGTDYSKVVSITNSFVAPNTTIITVSPALNTAPTIGQYVSLIKSTMSNKNDDNQWPGDPDYLEDKFVRFSYRFKFDDNEYSLMAPFTQIAYVPKQNGYFLNGDENAAYQSTIVGFMENSIQNIGLVIPLPSSANKIVSDYKISELEILFRESDGTVVKVLESITAGEISGASGVDNTYTYEYQSRKPYRTLPEAQTVRVYDKVPVRALAQESSGNRIIYGNFVDKQTPPNNINYNCRIANKATTGIYNNFVEYPNSSVKRNRNYQVGFVLADKFGRQSPVILSSVDLGLESNGSFYSGSTIYSSYDLNPGDTDVLSWFGDAIQVLVNEPITSEIDSATGTPGLYAINQQDFSTGEGFAVAAGFAGTPPTILGNTYTFTLDDTAFPNNVNIPVADRGNYMRGAYKDFVKVTNIVNTSGSIYEVTTNGQVNDIYLRADNLTAGDPDLKFAYTINDLGWYSYKIVVKQTEQEYYNVYLPGILNGYPGQSSDGQENGPFPGDELNLTAHTVLFNDNIQKIPRDLVEVGPDQKQYRSSVTLYGRVTNTMIGDATAYNQQYYPRLSYTGKNAVDHMATTIATAGDLDMRYNQLSGDSGSKPRNGNLVFYQIDTNPLIARISTTEKSIGATNINAASTGAPYNMVPYLAIYETAPVESFLDLYWETSSEGLIVDLNAELASSNSGAVGFTAIGWIFDETITSGTAVSAWFEPLNNQGGTYVSPTSAELISVKNGLGADADSSFSLNTGVIGSVNEGKFQLQYEDSGIVFLQGSNITDVYTFVIRVTTAEGDTSDLTIGGQTGGEGALKNLQPSFSTIADKVKTISNKVLIPASDWVSAVNGTALTGDNAKEQLIYTFTGSDIPDNWVMDPNSGELTQATPVEAGIATEFTGNPLGIFNITVRLSDANAINSVNAANGYTSLYAEQDVQIRLEPTAVNPGALSTSCVITPASPPANTVIDPATGVVGPFNNGQKVSCVYYISATDLTQNNEDNSVFFDNGIPNPDVNENMNTVNYRIGTDCHREGTISFSLNTFSPWNGSTNNINLFYTPKINFYYRALGETTWQPIPRNLEQNRVGYPGTLESPKFDEPQIIQDKATEVGGITVITQENNLVLDYGPDDVWMQTIRAFNYEDFNITGSVVAGSAGIEYAILVDTIQQLIPNTKANGIVRFWATADDLEYPTCVSWQGKNAVTENGAAGNLFQYRRSTESNNSTGYNAAGAGFIYARSPYGDYVNEFYTDATNFTPYIPSSPYINTTLVRTIGSTLTSWTTLNDPPLPAYPPALPAGTSPATDVEVQWVVGYDTVNGKKLINTGITGVSARQTTSNTVFNSKVGTLRVHKN